MPHLTRTIGIRELKNNLSAVLREVALGARLLVTDRDRVVAELHQPYLPLHPLGESISVSPMMAQWIASGEVKMERPGVRPPLPKMSSHKNSQLSRELLDEERSEER